MEPQTGVKTWQWVVTVIVIIILIIIGIMVFGSKKAPITETTNTGTPTSTDLGAGVNRIVMNDQYPGNVVYLNSVQFASPGWIAIQSDNAGVPGNVIGSAHFDAGINPGGKITLSSPMVEGGTYYAVMYPDNGTSTFDTSATPIKDANGNTIMATFHASASVGAGIKG